MSGLGRALMGLGFFIMVVGAAIWAAGRFNWRLPGDFVWHRGPVTVYFPLASMLLLSLLLTLLINLVWRR